MEYKNITHEEFINLKYGDIVYIRVANIFIKRIVYKTPFTNEKNEFILKTFKPRTFYKEYEIFVKKENN